MCLYGVYFYVDANKQTTADKQESKLYLLYSGGHSPTPCAGKQHRSRLDKHQTVH